MKGVIALIIIALVVIGGIAFFFISMNKDVTQSDLYSGSDSQDDSDALVVSGNEETGETITSNEPESQIFTVKITSSGFSPKNLEINQGDTVIWANEGYSSGWPASAMHPTHTVYPGSGISKCGTPQEDTIFDACKGLQKGESYSFTFNEVGTWYYHNHLSASTTGSITVK